MVIPILLTIAVSCTLLYALYLLNQPVRLFPMLIAIGSGMVAFTIALIFHDKLLSSQLLTEKQIPFFSAPLIEEILKAIFIIGITLWLRNTQRADAALYGFGIGVGFSILESGLYISVDPAHAMSVAVARAISVNLMHSVTTAIIGFGAAKSHNSSLNFWHVATLLGVAILIHAGSNFLTYKIGVYGFPVAIVLSTSGLMLIALLSKNVFVAPQQKITS
jgi:RsiW-degrading membrane proteinase PrsW (M82 family)